MANAQRKRVPIDTETPISEDSLCDLDGKFGYAPPL